MVRFKNENCSHLKSTMVTTAARNTFRYLKDGLNGKCVLQISEFRLAYIDKIALE